MTQRYFSNLISFIFLIMILVQSYISMAIVQEAEDYYHVGLIYYYRGDYDLAIEAFTKAIQLKPDYWEAYDGRGVAYISKGKFQ
jgi:tetratricopeptide (TPR) repeat protein